MNDALSRRGFVVGTVAVAGSVLLGRSVWAETKNLMNIESLKKSCKGAVTLAGNPGFKKALHGDLWNLLLPDRAPEIVLRAADEQDIIAAAHFSSSR